MSDRRFELVGVPRVCVGAALALATFSLTACSACGTRGHGSGGAPSASAIVASVPAPSASAAPLPPERRSVAERTALDAKTLLEKHSDLVSSLNRGREALGKGDAKEALELLLPLRAEDPLGAAVAITVARSAVAAGNFAVGAGAARVATVSAKRRDKLATEAQVLLGEALEKLGRPGDAIRAYEGAVAIQSSAPARAALTRLRKTEASEPLGAASPSSERRVESAEQACTTIQADIRAGKVDLAFSPERTEDVTCATDFTLDVKATSLRRALALRADVRTKVGTERAIWVALEDEKGLLLYGPVASVFGAPSGDVTNDVVVDLQQIDVLSGGSPEIVVKITEARTLPDIALAEALTTDVTRAVLLTVDRGGVQASREVVLSSRVVRDHLGPKTLPLPRGFDAVSGLGKSADFSMKVAWSGPNSMTLTKVSGSVKPLTEGVITLFP